MLDFYICASKENASENGRKMVLLPFTLKFLLRTYCVLSIQIMYCRISLMQRHCTKSSFTLCILTITENIVVTLVSVLKKSFNHHLDICDNAFGLRVCMCLWSHISYSQCSMAHNGDPNRRQLLYEL
jgi:hypothetical protein